MSLFIGLIGLPNAGKSTLFNALTRASAEASSYPFCTIEPNVGVVEVPDGRLRRLEEILQPARCTPTSIRFVDLAGLVRGASRGEGLGNQFLSEVRAADALVHVLRCFVDSRVAHVDGAIDPLRDAETVETELLLADLQSVEKALPRLDKVVRSDSHSSQRLELETLQKVGEALRQGAPVRGLGLSDAEAEAIKGYSLLTAKPLFYVANLDEAEMAGGGEWSAVLEERLEGEVLPLSARIEAEIAQLEEAEREEFTTALGMEKRGMERLVLAGYTLLGLITFYTIANDKLQAWQLPGGTPAPAAAGKVHSDMERGFIRAEVAAYAELAAAGSMARLREEGCLRTEGRDYLVADGDVVHFLFRT